MLLSSISFILIFLPVTVLLYFLVPRKMKNMVLLIASMVFYAWGEPVYVILLLLSVGFNYFCGQDIEEKRENPAKAKGSLVFAIVVNLLILGFFRYYGFLMQSVNALSPVEIPYRELAMPIGISYYTLRELSYIIDVYRNETKAQKNFVCLGLYISFFPQIAAGPVERYVDMERSLKERTLSLQRFGNGAMLFLCGLGKKVILADSMGLLQEQITGLQIGTFSTLTAWLGCAAFAFRFYFELSGYSDMAIGLGRIFGFDLHRNFNYPYISRSITEFWKRWNISLTAWFQRYVYEPLGGEKCEMSRQMWNLLIVGILTGSLYGADWKFLWWGVYCSIILLMERFVWGRGLARLPKIVQHLYAIVIIFTGWAFFFSPNLGAALDYIGVMFGFGASTVADTQALYYILTHWLLLVLCVAGASSRGMSMLHSCIEVPRSRQWRTVVTCVIYIGIFIISLAFLITGEPDTGLFIQF